jgi:fused signal recognition particle receptor
MPDEAEADDVAQIPEADNTRLAASTTELSDRQGSAALEPVEYQIVSTSSSAPDRIEVPDTSLDDTEPVTLAPNRGLSSSGVAEGSRRLAAPPELQAPAAEEAVEEVEAVSVREVEEDEPGQPRTRGFFSNPFKFGLGRTRQLFGRVNEALESDEISTDLWDELEEALITGDVGIHTTDKLMQTLRERVEAEQLTRGRQLRDALKEELEILLGEPEPLVFSDTSPISVYLVVGVNGVGKTTSIAKLANLLKRQKHRVMLAAADTFRAAATEQIKTWGERIGVTVISHQHGADPGAVVYDAMQAAAARGADVLIVDTAGRLHTKLNLMEELKKIMKVLQKYDPEAPHEVLLVMDATTGQNGFIQAKQFVADSGVSGVILTKLDGTARGGIVFAIASELGLPIKYVGTGEKLGDIAPFDPIQFVDALFEPG